MEERSDGLYFGGLSAVELAKRYSTPLYVYEEKTLRERAGQLKKAIAYPKTEIKYACKANTNRTIMRIFREEGISIDAVSPGEIQAALDAGFSPSRILYTVNNATWDEIDYGVSRDIMVNIDSLSQLALFGKRYPGKTVCIRINPNVGAGHHDHCITGGPDSKFGISYREVGAIQRTAAEHDLKIRGIHQHIGSGILEGERFIEAMDVLLSAARSFEGLDFIDFGGGIGVAYHEDEKPIDIGALGRKITDEFTSFCGEYGRELTLAIEPGRYLVAEAGYFLVTVTSVKKGEKHRFVGVNSGFNHLVRPAMYGSYHRIINATNPGGAVIPQTIAGNLCESGDTFTRDEEGIVDRDLPEFREGDTACICTAGAYGYSMASNYNSRPRPAEVLVGERGPELIRRRETLEDLFRTIPE